MTDKSLAESIDFNIAPRNEMLGFCGSLFNICLVPKKRSLVLVLLTSCASMSS